jgi:hypothetical protein
VRVDRAEIADGVFCSVTRTTKQISREKNDDNQTGVRGAESATLFKKNIYRISGQHPSQYELESNKFIFAFVPALRQCAIILITPDSAASRGKLQIQYGDWCTICVFLEKLSYEPIFFFIFELGRHRESSPVPVNGERAFCLDLKGCGGCGVAQGEITERREHFEQKNVIYLAVNRIFYKMYSIDNLKTFTSGKH